MPSNTESTTPTQLNKNPLIIVLTPSIRKSVIEGTLF
jgi:hypothetical protein